MWESMFVGQIPIAEKILRTIIIYSLVVVLFRLSGKRNLANLNTFDFAVIFLLSNVLQNSVIGEDYSLVGGMVGAVTLVVTNSLVDRIVASSSVAARLFEGKSVTVIDNGEVNVAAIRKLGVRRSELNHAVHVQSGDDISEIKYGSIEPNGQLVVTLKDEEQSATKADVADLAQRLDRLESLLTARS